MLEIYLRVTEHVSKYFIPNIGGYEIDRKVRNQMKTLLEPMKTAVAEFSKC